jgi:hypothetical protein
MKANLSVWGFVSAWLASGFLVPAQRYLIQSTVDLTKPDSWTTLTNLTLAQPVQVWVDLSDNTSLPTNAHRFYRVLLGQ